MSDHTPVTTSASPIKRLTLILAGGQSRRMGGQDKGLHAWASPDQAEKTLIDQVLLQIAQQTVPSPHIAISANRHLADYALRQHTVLPDLRSGHPGPLAGLEAGFAHTQTLWPEQNDANVWLWTLPCDVPYVPPDTLEVLLNAQQNHPQCHAFYIRHNHQDEPLFALCSRRCWPQLQHALNHGQRQVRRFWHENLALAVSLNSPHAGAFDNLNTPQDWARHGPASAPRMANKDAHDH